MCMVFQFMCRRTSFCTRLISKELCGSLLMFSTSFTSLSVLLLFPLSIVFFIIMHGFSFISFNIDEVFSIKPSHNAFCLETLTCSIRTGLPVLVELIDLVNSVIIFVYQINLLRLLTFLLGSLTVTVTVLLFWIYIFLSSETNLFVPQWLSLHWEILIMFLSQFPMTFQ